MNLADTKQKIQQTSVHTVIEETLAKCSASNLNALARLFPDHARAQVTDRETRLKNGDASPLLGVPVLLKDNICLNGCETTAGSKVLAGFRPPYSSTVAERLEAAGAIIIGTANMDEFAMGSSSETCCHGAVKNPHDFQRIPGGSSGGSASAVAAGLVPLALGSDTGGSIRQPAALCGCVGLKPTYGRVSRWGLIAFGSSLDCIGPLTTSVSDAAAALQILAGHDPRDGTSNTSPVENPTLDGDPARLKGLRVGIIERHQTGLSAPVLAALTHSISALQAAGATIVPVEMPRESLGIATYYVLATGEAASNLARYDGIHYGWRDPNAQSLDEVYRLTRGHGFGAEVKRRIMLGTYVLSAGYYDAYYKQAQKVRALIRQDYLDVFAKCDVLLGPTSPTTAPKLGENLADPLTMYLMDVFTISANLAGIPALSLPAGKDPQGLPIGLQLQAPAWSEGALLQTAGRLETLLKDRQ